MPRKGFRAEEIIAKLREADVLLGQGKKVAEVVKALGVSEVTYYRWRQEYGGMSVPQAKRLKELERENARPRRAVADLTLDKRILKEAAEGNFFRNGPSGVKSPECSSRRRCHASVRGRHTGRHIMPSEGSRRANLCYAWFQPCGRATVVPPASPASASRRRDLGGAGRSALPQSC
jgi:putative transposase